MGDYDKPDAAVDAELSSLASQLEGPRFAGSRTWRLEPPCLVSTKLPIGPAYTRWSAISVARCGN
ncbi:MAG: hypothetical protein CM1200mP26_15550 [Acidimicrobiales bacterium]|nr:MAG: hypothetical protein CM1200mP26_15550 [Acidimicrobiales bacterium]